MSFLSSGGGEGGPTAGNKPSHYYFPHFEFGERLSGVVGDPIGLLREGREGRDNDVEQDEGLQRGRKGSERCNGRREKGRKWNETGKKKKTGKKKEEEEVEAHLFDARNDPRNRMEPPPTTLPLSLAHPVLLRTIPRLPLAFSAATAISGLESGCLGKGLARVGVRVDGEVGGVRAEGV